MTSVLGFGRFYGPHMRGPGMVGRGFDGFEAPFFNPFTGIGLLLGLVVLGLGIYLVVRLVRESRAPAVAPAGGTDDATAKAIAILKERFARGEIGESEYERTRARLLDLPAPEAGTVSEEPAERGDA